MSNELNYLNDIIQGLIIILLVVNAVNTKTLSLFQLIVILIGISFSFYIKFINRIIDDY